VPREQVKIHGRDAEQAVLKEAFYASAEHGSLVVVRGAVGSGRTTLLDVVGRALREEGAQVLSVSAGDGSGVTGVTDAILARFEQLDAFSHADRVRLLARLRKASGAAGPGEGEPGVIQQLGALFRRLGRVRPTLLLLDDVHCFPEAAIVLRACARPGCLVVASCRDEVDADLGTADLLRTADQVIDLHPLADGHIDAVLAAFGALDDSVQEALRTALGPLYGRPGAVRATLDGLQASGRLVLIHGRLCLKNPAEPISPPVEPRFLDEVAATDDAGRHLLVAVAILGELGVDDLPVLAGILGEEVSRWGRALDSLVDTRVFRVSPAGNVRYVCRTLAARVFEDADPDAEARLHTALAEQLLARVRLGRSTDPATIAEHLVLAGRNPQWAPWLVARASAEPIPEDRAARWYAAALRSMPDDDPAREPIMKKLLRLLMRTGQYELMSEVLADQPARSPTGEDVQADLAAASMLVRLHCSPPHPGDPGKVSHDDPHGLAAWWLGEQPGWTSPEPADFVGDPLISGDELALIHHALTVNPRACADAIGTVPNTCARDRLDELIEAGAAGDVITVFRIVLGARYGITQAGPLAMSQKVVRGYTRADWAGALSAARQLELIGSTGSPAHQMARLYAAGVHLGRGDYADAAAWLATVTKSPRFAPARAIVECHLLHCAGKSREAVNLAWRTYQAARIRGVRGAADRLLLLALQIALRGGDRMIATELLDEIERLHRHDRCRCTEQVMLLGRALVHGDPASAADAVHLVLRRGHRPDILWAAEILAQSCDDPQLVLDELHKISVEGDSSSLFHERVTALLGKFGIVVPAAGVDPKPLSSNELRVIELVKKGHTNRQIAVELGISVKTVEYWLTRLFSRMGCRSRVELATVSLDGPHQL
jgi:DNA-binding NarL/FixJ family response regulator